MRPVIGLGLFLCSCQLLPQKQLGCADSEVCEPVVSAPFVLGQPDARTNRWQTGFVSPVSVTLAPGGQLFVADLLTNRFMVWNSFPTRNNQPADFVLGNANASLGFGCCNAEFVRAPRHLTFNGSSMIAMSADEQGQVPTQLYVWPSVPTMHTPPTMSWTVPLNMAPVLAGPGAPLVVNNRLYVSDFRSSRVLTWSPVPSAASTPVVIGQANTTEVRPNGNAMMATDRTLAGPLGLASDGSQLFVADSNNHRVMIWGPLPTMYQPAKLVLGQLNFNGGTSNQNRPTPDGTTLSLPRGVAVSGSKVAVADTNNHRVLLWNGPVTMSGVSANVALGQPSKTVAMPNNGGVNAARMAEPIAVATDGTRLAVSDSGNRRVLLWNSWPTTDGAPADVILGQPTPTANGILGYTPMNNNFLEPAGIARSAKGFFVVDRSANRVMIYATPPVGASESAIATLGQSDDPDPITSSTTLFLPRAVTAEGEALAVADTGNNRIAIWRNITAQNQQPIDVVLGQPNLDSESVNTGSPTVGLNEPQGVFLRGGKLYVADSGNHRVLIWNSVPTQNHQPADVVLGQADFMGTLQNRNGGLAATAQALNTPTAIVTDDTSIYVCDTASFRVLIWNTLTPVNGQPADLVLGQGDFAGNTAPASVADNRLSRPVGLSVFRNRLYVADQGAHRIVYYDLGQLRNGMSAQGVYGQADLATGIPNRGGLDIDRLSSPLAVLAIESGFYIADASNSRIVVQPPG